MTAIRNYPIAPPNPWCQWCGIDFEDDETPHRVKGKDYHRDCIEHAAQEPDQ